MIKVSKKLVYALEAVVDIGYNGGSVPVPSKDITKRQGVPHRYLEQVMQRLVHEGILKGVRGPKGGYLLAKERRRISVGEIARIVRSLESSEEDEKDENKSLIALAVLNPLWESLELKFEDKLHSITIEDICQSAYKNGIKKTSHSNTDFSI
ncbi:MAG: transcriptional regulator [Alphaproteobacteria bacterium]|nr:transcriptional regulator [Alphaproteobacteria bacterium]|tara:strand:- start:2921 stop:3376 length:456 start_codon:yes stop_codon:yes gene_type:complete